MTKSRYDLLEEAKALMQPVRHTAWAAPNRTAPALMKLVQTGQSNIFDYWVGFLIVEVSLRGEKEEGPFCVQVNITCIDDGGAEGWGQEYEDWEEALEQLEKVIAFFSEILVLPSVDELNIALRPLALYLTHF